MMFAAKNSAVEHYVVVLRKILGGLFILDGLSLLFRGIVGGLFLMHESSSVAFVVAFILHTIVGGAVYSIFGYSLLRDYSWARGLFGFVVAATAVAWALPSLGADYFTGFLGCIALLALLAARPWKGRTGGGVRYGEKRGPLSSRIMPFVLGSAVIVLLLFAFYYLFWPSIVSLPNAYGFSGIFCDFVNYYYPMGEAVFGTGLPVDGFLYSASVAVLLAAFPPLGLTASLVIWGILQAIFIILYVLLFRRLVPAGLEIQLLFVGLVLSTFPLFLNFMGGQVSVFIMVGILGALFMAERGRRAAAACLLAFAVGFKFYPIIFLAPFAARRDARFLLLGTTACIVFLFAFPGLLIGGGETIRFYGALVEAFRESGWVAANPHSQFFPHVILRLGDMVGLDVHDHLQLLRWVSYCIAAANMGLIFLVQRARLRRSDLWSFHLVFLTIPFVLKTSWAHDFYYLPFAQALLAWRIFEGDNSASEKSISENRYLVGSWRERAPHACAAMALLILLSIAFSSTVFFFLLDSPYRYSYYSFLFWANLLLLAVSYVELLPPALRRLSDREC